jgi:hypothetical protein
MINSNYKYCPCDKEEPNPCPACGATIEPQDKFPFGCCQLPPKPTDYGIRLILVHRDTGKEI